MLVKVFAYGGTQVRPGRRTTHWGVPRSSHFHEGRPGPVQPKPTCVG